MTEIINQTIQFSMNEYYLHLKNNDSFTKDEIQNAIRMAFKRTKSIEEIEQFLQGIKNERKSNK